MHERPWRDRGDGCATGQPPGRGPEAYLFGTSQGPRPEDSRLPARRAYSSERRTAISAAGAGGSCIMRARPSPQGDDAIIDQSETDMEFKNPHMRLGHAQPIPARCRFGRPKAGPVPLRRRESTRKYSLRIEKILPWPDAIRRGKHVSWLNAIRAPRPVFFPRRGDGYFPGVGAAIGVARGGLVTHGAPGPIVLPGET
jgi:hypothetical protein